VSIFFLLGAFDLCEVFFPEKIPDVHFLGSRKEKEWVFKNLNQTLDPKKMSDVERVAALRPSLEILDIVCPQVSTWFRSQYESDKIIYVWGGKPEIAKFDFLTQKLSLSDTFFNLREGDKVKILAHEYRHSIQNRSKFLKQVLFLMLTKELHEHIVEDEAEAFEYKIHVALRE
jgi:hypothetical protein